MRLGIVIPTLNEAERIEKTVEEIKKRVKDAIIIVVDDCSEDRTGEIAEELGCFVPRHAKKMGYGKSLCVGLHAALHTFGCDSIIEMDADHPVAEIEKFLKLRKTKNFVVVGYEEGGENWKIARKGACWLVRNLLQIKEVSHPTCGFVLFSKEILSGIPWKHVKSNGDAIHVELLHWAWKGGANFYEVNFSGHEGERYYGFWRMLRWVISVFRVWRLHWLRFWIEFDD